MTIQVPRNTASDARRFACTQCGKCCNRSPEVELSEAAALADMFVFRLMFRLYWLPRNLADYRTGRGRSAEPDTVFYEKKRLLSAFAAHKSPVRLRRNGKAVEHTKYLMISALALDTNAGACSALEGKRCRIHGRRPLSCRSVPLHYSRAEGLAESDLRAFLQTPGYRCDTGASAPIVLEGGRIVDAGTIDARAQAVATAQRDRPWSEAIVRRMKAEANASLPSLAQVEENAPFAATTTSMRIAWQVAAEEGLMRAEEFSGLMEAQLTAIRRELARPGLADAARQTLVEMQAEYAQARSQP